MNTYENLTLDQERALYGIHDAYVKNCLFEGPADGESALKETHHLQIENCDFHLRYPMWHMADSVLINCRMTDTCRAALWYDQGTEIHHSFLGGIKALRECDDTVITDTRIQSTEFGWYCRGLTMQNCSLFFRIPLPQQPGYAL